MTDDREILYDQDNGFILYGREESNPVVKDALQKEALRATPSMKGVPAKEIAILHYEFGQEKGKFSRNSGYRLNPVRDEDVSLFEDSDKTSER